MEEPLSPPAVEIEADMTSQIPPLSLFWLILIALFAVAFFPRNFSLDALASWGLGLLVIVALRLVFLLPLGRKQPAWIGQQGESVAMRTLAGSVPLTDAKVEWKDSTTLILKMGRHHVRLSFRTPEDALATVKLLKTKSPGLETVQ